jgi:hypothetical protein
MAMNMESSLNEIRNFSDPACKAGSTEKCDFIRIPAMYIRVIVTARFEK